MMYHDIIGVWNTLIAEKTLKNCIKGGVEKRFSV